MKGFEGELEDLEADAEVDWKPVELFKGRCYVFSGSGPGHDVGTDHLCFLHNTHLTTT